MRSFQKEKKMSKCEQMAKYITDTAHEYGITNKKQIAYIIATAKWETNHKCVPVREAYWLSEEWRKKHLRYYPYYGRGYAQITWKENYERFGKLLNLDLVNEPDLALRPEVASKILVLGMRDGLFTGVSLDDVTNDDGSVDFVKARKIINRTDKAETITSMAKKIQIA